MGELVLIKPQNNRDEIMADETVVIDMSGLEDKISKAVKEGVKGLEEKFTEIPKMQSTNEVEVKPSYKTFNYKKGISEFLVSEPAKGSNSNANVFEGQWYSDEVPEYIKKKEGLYETIGTLDPDCCVPEVWADDIQLTHVYGKSIFWGAWFVNWDQGIYQKPGDTVYWCKIPPMVAGTLACTEPATTAPTMTCPDCSLTGRVCAVAICIDDIEDAQTGLVDAINEAIGNCLSVAIDEYFINVALSCTNLGTMTSSGPMTGSLLIEAMGTMQMANRSKRKGFSESNLPTSKIGL